MGKDEKRDLTLVSRVLRIPRAPGAPSWVKTHSPFNTVLIGGDRNFYPWPP
jgi:hypothetical protein